MDRNRRLGRKAAQRVNYAALHGSDEDGELLEGFDSRRGSIGSKRGKKALKERVPKPYLIQT